MNKEAVRKFLKRYYPDIIWQLLFAVSLLLFVQQCSVDGLVVELSSADDGRSLSPEPVCQPRWALDVGLILFSLSLNLLLRNWRDLLPSLDNSRK
jgi:hypothetical protein